MFDFDPNKIKHITPILEGFCKKHPGDLLSPLGDNIVYTAISNATKIGQIRVTVTGRVSVEIFPFHTNICTEAFEPDAVLERLDGFSGAVSRLTELGNKVRNTLAGV